MSFAEDQAQRNAEFERGMSSFTQGTCVAVDWANRLAQVNIGGVDLDMPMVHAAPFPGDAVWVAYWGARPFCVGPLPKARTATVTANPGGGKVVVIADDSVEYVVPYDVSYTPAAGDRVVLDWASNGVIVCRMSAEPSGTIPVVPALPNPGGGSGARSFFATDSATWRSGGWADNTFSVSDTRSGFYWYGTQVRDTVPSSATVTGFGIQVAANRVPSSSVTLTLHAGGGRDGSPPAPLDTFVVSQDGGYKQLPLSWGSAMKDGTAFGIGSVQSSAAGWMEWQSASTSGALSISWA